MRDIGICNVVCTVKILLASARTVFTLSHRVVMHVFIKYHGHGIIHLATRWCFYRSSKAWVLLNKVIKIKLILIPERASLLLASINSYCCIGKVNRSSSEQCYTTLINRRETCVYWPDWIHSGSTHFARINNLNDKFK